MFDASGRLIREWDGSGMEDDWCCGTGQTGLHRHNSVLQLLHQRETRLQRVARFLAFACVLLVSVALALLVSFVLGARGQRAADSQPAKQHDNLSPGDTGQQKGEEVKNPKAMLTAPTELFSNYLPADHLKWEIKGGNAFCQGGFSYANGSLVVPRDGIYRVFLQITYESKGICSDDSWLKLINTVYSFSDGYQDKTKLLSSVDTVSCSLKQWSKSLYTSGLFELEADTSLSVMSSHPDLIVRKEEQVFFGAELLPP